MANDTEFGLTASVFTQDIKKSLRAASEFDSGMVAVNCISILFYAAQKLREEENAVSVP
jgi:aldehyde dehydrogenase (NAD+)